MLPILRRILASHLSFPLGAGIQTVYKFQGVCHAKIILNVGQKERGGGDKEEIEPKMDRGSQ
jgi:hypothetical protein